MTKAHDDARIDRPITEVFDFLADGTSNPRRQPLVVRTARSEGTLGVGTTFHQRVRHPLGYTGSAAYRIISYESPHLLAMTVTSGGPIRPTLTYILMPDCEATIMHCAIEHHLSGRARLATPILALLHPFGRVGSFLDRPGPGFAGADEFSSSLNRMKSDRYAS